MTETLTNERCVACNRDAPRLMPGELAEVRGQIPDWDVVEREGMSRLERVFRVADFRKALDLTNRVGELAEEENHHPSILVEWGRVTITWWTHKIQGLHRNDVIMAAKTDEVAKAL